MSGSGSSKYKARRVRPTSVRYLVAKFAPHLRSHRKALLSAGLCMVAVTAVELLKPWPLKVIFDQILMPERSHGGWMAELATFAGNEFILLALSALSILVIAVLGGLFGYGQSYLLANIGQRVTATIRLRVFSHIQRLSHSFHDERSLGDLLTRLTGDVGLLRQLLVETGIVLAGRTLIVVGAITAMSFMDWRLTLVALAVVPPLAFATARLGSEIKGATKQQRKKESQIAQVITEGISAISIVQAYAREAHEERRFSNQSDGSVEAGLAATKLAAHLERLIQVILAFGTCAVIWYGVLRVQAGALTPGDLLVFIAYLAGLHKPIQRVASITNRVTKATVAGERLAAILDIVPQIQDLPDAQPAPLFQGKVAFDDVAFGYRPDRPILRGVDFEMQPGETVALIGESGSGKSTIASLMLRFYEPTSGRVSIDGLELGKYTLASLRQQIAIVLQDTMLFRTSIRENISYGKADATFDEIVAAAKAADAHDFIESLPEGYDTIVGERGATLSGGQRQRISIARAMIRDAAIVILDEPMVGLDSNSEAAVRRALKRLMAHRTCLVITHDPRGVLDADRVLALRDGKITDITETISNILREAANRPALASIAREAE